ncbi:UDP-N-acetylmuramate dehydrogenase [Patescibacteria group bacterium]|nr:UDP-N-acetylmuramate dehydrogenase [Patescibacteria group bacterium]
MSKFKELNEKLGNRVNEDFALAPLTGYKIGGPAKYYFIGENTDDVKNAVGAAHELSLPVFILARGSNVLVSDKGFAGLVIHNKSKNISVSNTEIEADAGVNLSSLANSAKDLGLSGIEFIAGIPGSVGGAIRGNAGAWGSEIKNVLIKVMAVTESGEIIERSNKQCEFGYRESIFKMNKEIILSASFELSKSTKKDVQIKINEIVKKKKEEQEFESPSAGCVFKNTKVDFSEEEMAKKGIDSSAVNNGLVSSGYLIDRLGLKGFTVGGAMVSKVHGNFIINLGNATAEQIVMLIGIIKQKVRDKYGIQLQEEIQLIGFDNY